MSGFFASFFFLFDNWIKEERELEGGRAKERSINPAACCLLGVKCFCWCL